MLKPRAHLRFCLSPSRINGYPAAHLNWFARDYVFTAARNREAKSYEVDEFRAAKTSVPPPPIMAYSEIFLRKEGGTSNFTLRAKGTEA